MIPFLSNNYYYISIILQAICAIHAFKNGKEQKWIWIIVFLPIVGCVAYLFMEVLSSKSSYQTFNSKQSFSFLGNDIKRLEKELKFSDTFKNRVALAEAYQKNNQIDKAIIVYEDSLQGNFKNDEFVMTQLVYCYFKKNEFNKLVQLAQSIYQKPQFARSQTHVYYAIALGKVGRLEEAEKEYKMLNGKYAYFDARYNYALFLKESNRIEEAKHILKNILNDAEQMSRQEKSHVSNWIHLSKELMNNL